MKIAITDLDPSDSTAIDAAIALLQRIGAAGGPIFAPLEPIGNDAPDVGLEVQTPGEAFGAPATPEAAFGGVLTPEAAFGDAGNVPAAVGSPATSTPDIASSAPAAPSAPPVAGAPAPAVDKRGLPHDPRIHASTKAMNADNTWRAKRGVDPALVAQVEAELLAFMGQPTGGQPAIPREAPPAPAAAPQPPAPPAPPAPNAAPGAVTVTAANAGAVATTDSAYPEAVQKIAGYLGAGKLTQAELTSACMQYGAAALPLFNNRPDLLRQLVAHIENLVLLKG